MLNVAWYSREPLLLWIVNVYLWFTVLLVWPGGDVWPGRQQVSECRVPSVNLRPFIWRMGQVGKVGNPTPCLLRQCSLAYTSATPFVSFVCSEAIILFVRCLFKCEVECIVRIKIVNWIVNVCHKYRQFCYSVLHFQKCWQLWQIT